MQDIIDELTAIADGIWSTNAIRSRQLRGVIDKLKIADQADEELQQLRRLLLRAYLVICAHVNPADVPLEDTRRLLMEMNMLLRPHFNLAKEEVDAQDHNG